MTVVPGVYGNGIKGQFSDFGSSWGVGGRKV